MSFAGRQARMDAPERVFHLLQVVMNGGDDDRDMVRRVLGTVTRTFRLVSPMTCTVDDEPKVAIDPTQYWRAHRSGKQQHSKAHQKVV